MAFEYRHRTKEAWEKRVNQPAVIATEWLRQWRPSGPWLLTAIHPDSGRIATSEFTDLEAAHAWIEDYNGERNLYFSPNPTRPGLTSKAKKDDVTELAVLHIDLDPPKHTDLDLVAWQDQAIAKLAAFQPPPSDVVRSGNGLQGYWRLKPVPVNGNIGDLEAYNIALEQALCGDHCHNIDRIMRLPGTINLPDKRKRDLGRVPVQAQVVHSNPAQVYTLDDFRLDLPTKATPASPPPSSGQASPIKHDLATLIRTGDATHWDGDRSRALLYVAARLVEAGWSDDRIIAVLLDPQNGISAHALDQSDPERAVHRAIAKAREDTTPKQASEPVPTELGEWDYGEADIDPTTLPPREWLLGMWMCRQFLSLLIGDGEVGKTAFRIACALALCTGREFLLKERVWQPHCNVLLLTFEDGELELKRRIAAAQLHHQVSNVALKGRLFVKGITNSQLKLALATSDGLAPGPLYEMLKEVIRNRKIDAVLFDPLIKVHGVPENDNMAMDFVVNTLVALAVEFNIAVDSTHHVTKGTASPGNADAGRGASAVKDGGKLVYTLTVMSEETAKLYGIDPEERTRYIRIDRAKANLVPPGKLTKWFKLVGVKLGNTTVSPYYDSGDEVQTVEPYDPPSVFERLSRRATEAILDKIEEGYQPERTPGRLYSGVAQAKERGAWKVVQEFAYDMNDEQAKAIVKAWIDGGVLVRIDEYPYTDENGRVKKENGVRVGKRPDAD
jgi:hypothetical protein